MIHKSYQRAIAHEGIIIGVVFFLIILGVINLILSGSNSTSPIPTPTPTPTSSPTSPTPSPSPTLIPTPTPPVQECNCSAWQNQGCGKGDCSAGERLETRSCSPTNCSAQKQCVQDPNCPFFDIPSFLGRDFQSLKTTLGDPKSNQTIQIPLYNISKLGFNDAQEKYPVIVSQVIVDIPDEVASTPEGKWNRWRSGVNNIISLLLKNWDDLNETQKAYFRGQGIDNSQKWENYKERTLCCTILPPRQCSKEGSGQVCFSFPWKASYQKESLMLDIYYTYQPENCMNILVKEGINKECCCGIDCPGEEECSVSPPAEQNWVWYFYFKDPGKTKNELLKMGNLEMDSTHYTISEDKDGDGKLIGLYISPK